MASSQELQSQNVSTEPVSVKAHTLEHDELRGSERLWEASAGPEACGAFHKE